MKEFLLAESGATKATWIHYRDGKETQYQTSGLNPYHYTNEEFTAKLTSELPITTLNAPIYFFGAGCGAHEQKQRVQEILQKHFTNQHISVYSDLEGACMAATPNKPGIVAIIGTGVSCCRYNGTTITQQAPSLGYLLGDEGSGTSFGKTLVQLFLRNDFPPDLREAFTHEFNTVDLLKTAYMQAHKAAHLASYFTFIPKHKQHPYIQQIIHTQLGQFITYHLLPLQPTNHDIIHFCGSVSYFLQEEITALLKEKNWNAGNFVQHPAHALLQFYKNQNT